MCLFMNKTIVTSIFVVLALLLSTTWDLLAVKILLTAQHRQASQTSQASVSGH